MLYNRGLYAAMLAAEAARKAQEIARHGRRSPPAMMRDGMEALEITEARMAELGLPNFGPAFNVTCENHGGAGLGGRAAVGCGGEDVVADLRLHTRPISEVIEPLVDEDSAAFAAENNIDAAAATELTTSRPAAMRGGRGF